MPSQVSNLNHALLAYNGTPKSKEALYLGTYLVAKWGIRLSILVIDHEEIDTDATFSYAQEYISEHNISANFIRHETGKRSDIILSTGKTNHCDFILMGGYKSSSVVEVVLGSVVDEVLRQAQIPLLICR